jgi:hypothetical protein
MCSFCRQFGRATGRTGVPNFIRNLRDFTGVLARGGIRVAKLWRQPRHDGRPRRWLRYYPKRNHNVVVLVSREEAGVKAAAVMPGCRPGRSRQAWIRTPARVCYVLASERGAAPLFSEELRRLDVVGCGDYLSIGQIYLLDNPLLREQLTLEHVKPRLLGH